jgi:hypothetical protein
MNVIKGPAAVAVGKYWVGVATGNRYCKKLRRTVEKALEDAEKLEPKGWLG